MLSPAADALAWQSPADERISPFASLSAGAPTSRDGFNPVQQTPPALQTVWGLPHEGALTADAVSAGGGQSGGTESLLRLSSAGFADLASMSAKDVSLDDQVISESTSAFPPPGSDRSALQTTALTSGGQGASADAMSQDLSQPNWSATARVSGAAAAAAPDQPVQTSLTTPAASTVPGTIPAAPSGLAVSAIASDEVHLKWTDNAGDESGFRIERKMGVGGSWSELATVGANQSSYQDTSTSLTGSTAYYYRVRAFNGAGNSTY